MSGNEHHDDVTVLRADSSISTSFSAEGSGEADAPRVLKQRFVLEEKLGSGGMGTVFRAKDLRKVEARDRQPYLAVKVLNNDFREHPEAFIALQREAAKSQTLSHPNIVSIFDFDKDGDLPFITMELLEGQELAQLIRAYPNGLPEPMAWDVIRGICAGLSQAHAAGIVHADFKPGNVYVAPNNTPKILDFGIARAVQMTEAQGDDTLFDPARLAALTPAYASREMLAGDNPELRDDLYSLGIVIYLILTGHHPYGRVSAEDAAKEGLKPEKPKGVTRRQWQIINRCLAFNRQDRPQDMAEVERYLLTPSPWPSRGILAAAATLLLALSVNFLIGDAELSEVKQEVRQSTLLDAQLNRIVTLLETPLFDENWENLVWNEFVTLNALDETGEQQEEIADRIRSLYTARIRTEEDLDTALALLEGGRRFGGMTESQQVLESKALARVRHLLDTAKPDEVWLSDLGVELARARSGFQGSPALAELELEVSETLEFLVQDALRGDHVDEAELLLSELSHQFLDVLELTSLEQAVDDARSRQLVLREARQLAQEQRTQVAELDQALTESCMRIDPGRLASFPLEALGDEALVKVSDRLAACLAQLSEFDPDRTASLDREIQNHFGDTLLLERVAVDPCSLNYLVGNGSRSGRQGYCVDRISDDAQGPRLVVVPAESGSLRFAMTKEEVSWSQFRKFCLEQEGCRREELEDLEVDDRLPVTRVSAETVRDFARWLSETTGYTYRLPTAQEWVWAAQGEPDPNRNCRVQLDGVERGVSPIAAANGQSNEFGLLNMLGNVQEWVVDGDRLVAVGGSFSDPIGACIAATSRDHEGEPAPDTGFRLVRELS
jgi:serine/threonine protein kinase